MATRKRITSYNNLFNQILFAIKLICFQNVIDTVIVNKKTVAKQYALLKAQGDQLCINNRS